MASLFEVIRSNVEQNYNPVCKADGLTDIIDTYGP